MSYPTRRRRRHPAPPIRPISVRTERRVWVFLAVVVGVLVYLGYFWRGVP